MQNQLMSVHDVARYMGVSSTTVRRWISSGRLPGQKAGGQWRFDIALVREAFGSGTLSSGSQIVPYRHLAQYSDLPEWARQITDPWRDSLSSLLGQLHPDHVVVTDRMGAKVWTLVAPDRYAWGESLWHSTAVRLMPPAELRRLFAHRSLLLFDEMMQHGREMHELRGVLEAIHATVFSFVCVRRRSCVESGRVIEYKARVCEDLDDDAFAARATAVSSLQSLFDPPLDQDHVVVRGMVDPATNQDELLGKMEKWGIAFVVRYPDPDKGHRFLTITLDRPQFFDTTARELALNLAVSWDGPCKIRFYLDPRSGECYCSFIVYPIVEGVGSVWEKTTAMAPQGLQGQFGTDQEYPSSERVDSRQYLRAYEKLCRDLALGMLSDFIVSGAASDIGIHLTNIPDAVMSSQLRATFGPSLGEEMSRNTKQILSSTGKGPGLFPQGRAVKPPTLFITEHQDQGRRKHDPFECRQSLMRLVPQRYLPDETSGNESPPIPYRELFHKLSDYSESTIGQVLDYELDWGTVKPVVKIEELPGDDEGGRVVLSRGFYRGEYGPWFEWTSNMHTNEDKFIKRTLVLAPAVMEMFLQQINKSDMTGTQFAKLFSNLCHDWHPGFGELYLGWKAYKYGPVPIVPRRTTSGEHMLLDRFLMNLGCVIETRESGKGKSGVRTAHKYRPAGEEKVPWRSLYNSMIDPTTKASISGLVRLYGAINNTCKSSVATESGTFPTAMPNQPIVVVASARNERITYRCCWFEVSDWRDKGDLLFPWLETIAANDQPPVDAFLRSYLSEFAAPARLLYEKIEMYRNLPSLRRQIEALRDDGFDFAQVILASMDIEPIIRQDGDQPVGNLVWACAIMRSFSSLMRQVLTSCGLDVDDRSERSRNEEDGRSRNASFYLAELLSACPEMTALEQDLRRCIESAKGGRLTMQMAATLFSAFRLVTNAFEAGHKIPDPRPWSERAREQQEQRDGLLVTFREVQMADPYAIAVADVYNFLRLPIIGEMLGVPYDAALGNLEQWITRVAAEVADRHGDTRFIRLSGDQLIFAGPSADQVFEAIDDLMQTSAVQIGNRERRLVDLALFRSGIAWHDDTLGEGYQGVQPGLTAYTIGDKAGLPPGTIRISRSAYDRLSPRHQEALADTGEESPQGKVYQRDRIPNNAGS